MADLVDQFGKSVRASAMFKSPVSRPEDFKRITPPRPKTFEAVLAWQRRELVDISRVIAAGVPTIDDALTQAGEFSVGDSWHIKSRGVNRAWGKKRDELFNTVYARDCNLRGTQNDWWSTLRQLNWTRKVQGDYGVLFDGIPYQTSDGQEIPPSGKFHIVTYDRIGTGINVACSVGGGLEQVNELGNNYLTSTYPTLMVGFYGMYRIDDTNSIFDGERIIDGVIVDANMRTLGYRLNGFNAVGRAVYVDIPKAQLHLNFSARKMVDMVRGFPEIAEQIIPVLHLDDIQDLISMAMKLASRLAITRESADGRPAASGVQFSTVSESNTDGSVTKTLRAVQELYPGLYEVSTNNKESLKTLNFDRPSMNEEVFVERIETAVLHKLWPRSLIYSDNAGRAGTRAIAVQARTICGWDQRCLERTARWITDRWTVHAMREGWIPTNNNVGEPFEYVFTVPGQFTVDEGNDSKMRLSALGRCTISRGIICEADGYLAEEIEEQREAEEDRLMAAAERLAKKHTWLTPKETLLRLDSGESNISFSDQNQPDPAAAPKAPDPNGQPSVPPANREGN